jgi:anthranilate/para-aminobenzoate synthase component II
MKILVLDNYDSFTYNSGAACCASWATAQHDGVPQRPADRWSGGGLRRLLLSPGPGIPALKRG